MAMIGRWMTSNSEGATGLGLLLLRLVFGGFMAVGHGWVKVEKFADKPASFPDPLGIGGAMSFYGAVGAELVCGVLLVLGLFTRLACLPLIFTMAVAAGVVHAKDPLFMSGAGGAKEPALVYLAAYLALLLLGPGRFSLDSKLFSAGGKATKAPR